MPSACSWSWATSGAAWRAAHLLAVAVDLLGHDVADLGRLGGALGYAAGGPVAQVVEVEQRDAGQVGDGGVDVAGHGHVDHQQRPAGGGPLDHRRRRSAPSRSRWT